MSASFAVNNRIVSGSIFSIRNAAAKTARAFFGGNPLLIVPPHPRAAWQPKYASAARLPSGVRSTTSQDSARIGRYPSRETHAVFRELFRSVPRFLHNRSCSMLYVQHLFL